LLKLFTLLMFKINGWKVDGKLPPGIKKSIIVAGPHTSNFDFIYAMGGLYTLGIPVNYLIKKEWLNNILLGHIFKGSGALSVDRSRCHSMVDTIAGIIRSSRDDLHIMISPEGTRKLVHQWKTGFYYSALKANVPLVLFGLDYSKNIAVIGPTFMPTGCFRRDVQIIKEFYREVTPKYPKNFSLQVYLPDDQDIYTC